MKLVNSNPTHSDFSSIFGLPEKIFSTAVYSTFSGNPKLHETVSPRGEIIKPEFPASYFTYHYPRKNISPHLVLPLIYPKPRTGPAFGPGCLSVSREKSLKRQEQPEGQSASSFLSANVFYRQHRSVSSCENGVRRLPLFVSSGINSSYQYIPPWFGNRYL